MFVAQLNKYYIPATEEGGAVGSFLKQMQGRALLFFQTSQLYCQSQHLLSSLFAMLVFCCSMYSKEKPWLDH